MEKIKPWERWFLLAIACTITAVLCCLFTFRASQSHDFRILAENVIKSQQNHLEKESEAMGIYPSGVRDQLLEYKREFGPIESYSWGREYSQILGTPRGIEVQVVRNGRKRVQIISSNEPGRVTGVFEKDPN